MNKFKQITLAVATFLSVALLAGCNNGSGNTPSQGDKNWVDYTQSAAVRLSLDYKGRDFYKDGIGQVKLYQSIDGDTAHFTTTTTTLKARFFGIDTPESTGKVQEWGVPASNFTKKK